MKQQNKRTLAQHTDEHLDFLEGLNLANATIETYRYRYDFFVKWADMRGFVDAEEVTYKSLKGFQKYMKEYKRPDGELLVVETQHAIMSTIRKFFGWLNEEGELASDPAARLKLPNIKHNKLPKRGLSVEEVERIFKAPDVSTKLGLRDRAMLAVLYSTGIRRAELVAIDLKDVDLEARELAVTDGKGGTERMAVLGDAAVYWIKLYLEESRPEIEKADSGSALFLNKNAKRISVKGMTHITNRIFDKAGISKKGATHLFRHTFCTILIAKGCPLRHAQDLMGHQSLQYIARYSKLDLTDLKEALAKYHPAA